MTSLSVGGESVLVPGERSIPVCIISCMCVRIFRPAEKDIFVKITAHREPALIITGKPVRGVEGLLISSHLISLARDTSASARQLVKG
ncbi:hypothetical protein KOW79_007136 [Hemibagrus wyckioides]|uniref:Uncharacterized protein n=1 Tax=Hemibagrus wyckioides TaxID=337641 RepID=A0A9D3NV53_9TELE|nr:hypothetical protein KOW79_007136 [Hemibagrus wyckioides]